MQKLKLSKELITELSETQQGDVFGGSDNLCTSWCTKGLPNTCVSAACTKDGCIDLSQACQLTAKCDIK